MKRIVNIQDGLIFANMKQVRICVCVPHEFLLSLKLLVALFDGCYRYFTKVYQSLGCGFQIE
jgi:hypothetical protein